MTKHRAIGHHFRMTAHRATSVTRRAQDLTPLRKWVMASAYIATATPCRLSTTQLAVFSFAALAARSGNPTTFLALREIFEGSPGGSVHTTYNVFLDRKRQRGGSLGWLYQVQNPLDMRQKFLHLTSKGHKVADKLLQIIGE